MQQSVNLQSSDFTAIGQSLRKRVLSVSANDFESLALDIFQFQAKFNPVYRAYIDCLRIQPAKVTELSQIPFMPIGFFKRHVVLSVPANLQPSEKTAANGRSLAGTQTFASSGTTEAITSTHYVPDVALYNTISQQIFEQQYGPLTNFHILALLPSYLERNNSSLVYMVQQFILQTGSDQSGFYLNNLDELTAQLHVLLANSDRKILLIGVTFALLDWIESQTDLSFLGNADRVIVMETGGMKGRRKELLREEVHELLTERTGISAIHSEYGMTELLSQAYSQGGGVFTPGATMRILLRDINDPFLIYPPMSTRTGGINVIDLANLDSCAFIETQDLGQYGPTDTFRVIGRFDNSDLRGCNLLVIG